MPTITVQVGASADDARNINGATSKQTNPATMHIGKFNTTDKYWNGFIFPNVTIPQGTTITSATLDLYSAAAGAGTTAKSRWYGILELNAPVFNTTTVYPEGKPRTTAFVDKDFTVATWNGSTGFGKELVDVTTLVQEIVNQGSWASGNRMGMVAYDNGSSNTNYIAHNTYDSNSARGAKLVITYGSTGPTAPTSLSGSQSGNQINLSWTDNSSDEDNFVLERQVGGSSNWYQIATPAANATTYSDTDVAAGYTYRYRIKAINTNGSSSYATSSDVTMSGTKAWRSHIQGWIYPGQADAQTELIDGRILWGVKPEYGTVDNSGVYSSPTAYVNDYGDAAMTSNAINYTRHPYFTVSANNTGMTALVADSTLKTNCINGILAVLAATGFEGVELDWEGYGQWTGTAYTNYKTFVAALCTAVQAVGKKVMICGPPIGDATEQGYYQWHYEDFESSSVDYIGVLAYDWDFDFGAGTAIAPITRVQNCCLWIRGKITNIDRIVMGQPNYGYYGTTAGFSITNITEEQAKLRTGYSGRTSLAGSNEKTFASGGVSTVFVEQAGMNTHREMIEDEGIKNISVWHMGDNPWFSGKAELDTLPNRFVPRINIVL